MCAGGQKGHLGVGQKRDVGAAGTHEVGETRDTWGGGTRGGRQGALGGSRLAGDSVCVCHWGETRVWPGHTGWLRPVRAGAEGRVCESGDVGGVREVWGRGRVCS